MKIGTFRFWCFCVDFGHFNDPETQLRVLHVLLDSSLTVKAAPHEYVIRTSQP